MGVSAFSLFGGSDILVYHGLLKLCGNKVIMINHSTTRTVRTPKLYLKECLPWKIPIFSANSGNFVPISNTLPLSYAWSNGINSLAYGLHAAIIAGPYLILFPLQDEQSSGLLIKGLLNFSEEYIAPKSKNRSPGTMSCCCWRGQIQQLIFHLTSTKKGYLQLFPITEPL